MLKDLQKTFADVVIKGDRRSPLPIQEHGLSAEARLSVYQRNTFGTLTEFLELSYPKTLALVGIETFRELARSLIQQHPPKEANLDQFAFTFEPFIASSVSPFVQAMAHFENALREVLLTPMPPALDPQKLEQLAQADPENIRFQFHPSTRLYEASYAFTNFGTPWRSPPKSTPNKKVFPNWTA